ncbi:MAG: hypothetical protein Ta2E_11930 [Mycoplasmoidaceae bacterium]|nr:MAG: hypothetical protein Ta2E_11930 [Mycoplasmoidaceae bacterium]
MTDMNEVRMYQLPKNITETVRNEMMDELFNREKMLQLIKSRGNLSAPGLDNLTNPILKLDYENTAIMLIEMMKTVFESGVAPA